MYMKKYKKYVKPAVGLAATGVGIGVASGLMADGAAKTAVSRIGGTAVGVGGTVLGASMVMEAVNDLNKYTQKKLRR